MSDLSTVFQRVAGKWPEINSSPKLVWGKSHLTTQAFNRGGEWDDVALSEEMVESIIIGRCVQLMPGYMWLLPGKSYVIYEEDKRISDHQDLAVAWLLAFEAMKKAQSGKETQ